MKKLIAIFCLVASTSFAWPELVLIAWNDNLSAEKKQRIKTKCAEIGLTVHAAQVGKYRAPNGVVWRVVAFDVSYFRGRANAAWIQAVKDYVDDTAGLKITGCKANNLVALIKSYQLTKEE